MTGYSETRRQIVHISMSVFALALRVLTWPQALVLAATALLFNLLLLRRVAPSIIRPTDTRADRAGVIFYPLSVALLILIFRHRLDLVAAAWGVLAFGDGVATLAGKGLGGPRLPWNEVKTWSGLVAGFVAGALGAAVLAAWVAPSIQPAPSLAIVLWGAIAAAAAGALVETIPVRLDDNVSVPLAAALVLALVSAIEPAQSPRVWHLAAERWLPALGVNALFSALVWLRGSVTLPGVVVGSMIGIVIYIAAGLAGWALLFIAFAAAVLASRVGLEHKQALGIAEERGGRRGAGNALANCIGGAAGAWLMLVADSSFGALVLVTGLVAGASDTVASEIGKAWGGQPRILPVFHPVPAGTPGAVSVVGTIAGTAAAAGMAALAAALDVIGPHAILPITVAATAGAFIESVLAARYENHGILNNDLLNFLNTAAAVAVLAALTFIYPAVGVR